RGDGGDEYDVRHRRVADQRNWHAARAGLLAPGDSDVVRAGIGVPGTDRRRDRVLARDPVQRHDGSDVGELQRPRIRVRGHAANVGWGDWRSVAYGRVRRAAARHPRGATADHGGAARSIAASPTLL